MGGLSIGHWILVLVIVLVIFGTKRLRNIGSDLGGAMRDFKKGLSGGDEQPPPQQLKADAPVTPAPAATEEKREQSH